jgi:hypothetical protein
MAIQEEDLSPILDKLTGVVEDLMSQDLRNKMNLK